MIVKSRSAAPRGAMRLFATYAIASLIPVLVLGLVLADSYRRTAASRGLSEGRAEAALLARTAVEPLLGGRVLSSGLSPAQTSAMRRMSNNAIATGHIVRLRLRDLSGRIVFATDPGAIHQAFDDEALDAAHGEVVSKLTHLDADDNPRGPQGVRVAEVYRPLTSGTSSRRVGVLEVYLPYEPIAHDVDSGLGALYRDLGIGLAMLYLLLAGISLSVTRKLRAQVDRNAYLAEHDPLTGLPNRVLFQRRVTEAIAAADRRHEQVTVALIDLDRFKEVNDTLGHGNGDLLLRQLGARLAEAVHHDEMVARLGGDEFGLVIAGPAGPDSVESRLARLREVLLGEIEVGGLPLAVDSSIGYAAWPVDGSDVDDLVQHADIAMYVAKSTHVGIQRYDRGQDHYDSNKLALVAELKRAIARDELILHYQPKASVSSGEVLAVEALVRWEHPERGLLYPDAFVPIAEQTGIIDSLTTWVLARALLQVSSWGDGARDLAVAINISARNVSRNGFAEDVLRALTNSGLPAERLLLEITETALVADPERAAHSLRRLAAAGVRISLDDFGRGQTSLGYLSSLPLHEVKIDKSFVLDMLDDRSHAAIVRSVIDLAHNLGFEVVAEGVETEQILAALGVLGCDIAQGYLLARPMPAPAVVDWLANHRHPAGALVPQPVERV